MSNLRDAFRITAEREREISARIAEAVSCQLGQAGDVDGANAATEIARLIREDGLPEIREAFHQEQRQRSESILSKGWLGQRPSQAKQEMIRGLREIDPKWSGKKPIDREPIEVRTSSGLSAVQLILKVGSRRRRVNVSLPAVTARRFSSSPSVRKPMETGSNQTAGQEGLTASESEIARLGGLGPNLLAGNCSDPLLQGGVAYVNLLQTGLTMLEAAKRLEVSEARIHQRLHDRTLLAFRDGQVWKLPLFQFTEEGELPGWEEIAQRLPRDMSPVALEQWLLLPNPDLVTEEDQMPMSPRVWLQEGRPVQAVTSLAGDLS